MSGALQVGDPLPPEREFAAQLGVSRAGVREAVRVLETQGVVRSQVGAGRTGGTFIAALPSGALEQFLRLHVALANFPISDVVEARIALERSSAEQAARRFAQFDPADMQAALSEMDAQLDERERFNDADTRFHIAIAQAGGNELFSALTSAIRSSLRGQFLRQMQSIEQWRPLAEQFQQQHRGIFEAISAGDPELAAERTQAHIEFSTTQLLVVD